MNDDERFIIEKAEANLEAAELLKKQGFIDISASRAYYAMFYLAEAVLMRKKQAYSSHSAVIAAYGREFAKTGVLDPKYHQYLIKAQQLRQTGDYGRSERVSEGSVNEALSWARDFFQAVVEYLKS